MTNSNEQTPEVIQRFLEKNRQEEEEIIRKLDTFLAYLARKKCISILIRKKRHDEEYEHHKLFKHCHVNSIVYKVKNHSVFGYVADLHIGWESSERQDVLALNVPFHRVEFTSRRTLTFKALDGNIEFEVTVHKKGETNQ